MNRIHQKSAFLKNLVQRKAATIPRIDFEELQPLGSQNLIRCNVRIRGALIIHIAAYVFSAFILGSMTFSYYRSSSLICVIGTSRIDLVSASGRLFLCEILDWPLDQQFLFEFTEPVAEDTHANSDGFDGLEESHILGVTFGTYGLKVEGSTCRTRYLVVPQYFFLLPPMMWICSFYLSRLRRRSVPELSDESIAMLMAEVPDRNPWPNQPPNGQR